MRLVSFRSAKIGVEIRAQTNFVCSTCAPIPRNRSTNRSAVEIGAEIEHSHFFHEDGPQNRSRRRQNRSTEAKIGALSSEKQKFSELRDKIGVEITLCFRQKSELSSDFYSDFALLKKVDNIRG